MITGLLLELALPFVASTNITGGYSTLSNAPRLEMATPRIIRGGDCGSDARGSLRSTSDDYSSEYLGWCRLVASESVNGKMGLSRCKFGTSPLVLLSLGPDGIQGIANGGSSGRLGTEVRLQRKLRTDHLQGPANGASSRKPDRAERDGLLDSIRFDAGHRTNSKLTGCRDKVSAETLSASPGVRQPSVCRELRRPGSSIGRMPARRPGLWPRFQVDASRNS